MSPVETVEKRPPMASPGPGKLLSRAFAGRSHWWGTAGTIVAVVALSFLGSDFQMRQWSQWLVFSILALSFVWVWGHGGVFSFAQVAFFGLGAYTYGVVSLNLVSVTGETGTALLAGVIAGGLLAALIGYFLFYGNVSDVYVAIATLAVSLVFYTFMSSTADAKYTIGKAHLGGFNGMIGIPSLNLGLNKDLSFTFFGRDYFVLVGVVAVIVALVIVMLRQTAFGRKLAAIRVNESRAALLGIRVPRQKLLALVISGGMAGLAGGLYAAWGNFVDPTAFGLQMATLLAVWVVAGGKSSVVGAFVGVFLIQQVTNKIASTGSTYTPLVLGLILIVIVLTLPKGIAPAIGAGLGWLRSRLTKKQQTPGAGEPSKSSGKDMAELLDSLRLSNGLVLEAVHVKKSFGGVNAVRDVSAKFGPVGAYCLIGPNGAGKSTFFHALVGTHTLTGGSVTVNGTSVSNRDASWRVRHGISIKSQVPSLFPELSVRENVWIAAQATANSVAEADHVTASVLAWLGYDEFGAAAPVENVAHGDQQWLDIAMALAQQPRTLFLDEPAAGMGKVESSRVAEMVRKVAQHIPVIVVDHDMEFVRQLDAPISVLHQGELLVTGTLEELRDNEQVQRVYLGRS
ncbi:MAG: ATP-binding cassette domain-containing protein [Micrococcales bacterium]|nr:ATP-binding cassette domain-containing protein [Micrococcales bacterium]